MALRTIAFSLSFLVTSSPAYAQDGDFFVSAGAENRTQKVTVSGILFGSLAPETPFDDESRESRIDGTLRFGYDHPIGEVLFLGVEAGGTVGELEQVLTGRASATATQTMLICFPAPPPQGNLDGCWGGPPFISETTTVYDETQQLDLGLKTGPSATLAARAGVRFGGTRIWTFGGVSAQRIRAAYDLPVVNTAIPPVSRWSVGPPGSSFPERARTTTLPAERISESRRMTGATFGAGIEQRVAGKFSLIGRYAYVDYGEMTLAATTRLAPVRITSKSHSVSVGLGVRF